MEQRKPSEGTSRLFDLPSIELEYLRREDIQKNRKLDLKGRRVGTSSLRWGESSESTSGGEILWKRPQSPISVTSGVDK